ncbi:MAG: HDOD domain-containing protein [Planctomycetota bacterium]|nr:HDOD domain-containing protein [Planctomycetota bacterium]
MLMRRLGDSSVPTLPEVAVKVVQLVGNPNSSFRDFTEVVQTDQALTGRLLRTANSALFAQRAPVTQLQRAMVLLGLDRLKAMALGFHLSQAAAKDNGDDLFRRVWSLSLFRAWVAFRLTEFFDRRITGEAFIVGLMLDAGVPMMRKLAGEAYSKAVNHADLPAKQHLCELRELPFTHVDVIGALLRMWKIPPLLAKPIGLHHQSPESMNPQDADSVLHSVAYFVGSLQLDPNEHPAPTNAAAAVAKRLFGLESDDLVKTFKNAAADYRASRELFSEVLDADTTVEAILARANTELNGAVENFVEDSITAAPPALRFECDGLVLEMVPGAARRVTVFIADAAGNRLLSEEIDPAGKSSDELARMLMLEEAPADTVERVVEQLRGLAA